MNIYIVNGQQYEKVSEDNNGNWMMLNKQTKQIRRVPAANFHKMATYNQDEAL